MHRKRRLPKKRPSTHEGPSWNRTRPPRVQGVMAMKNEHVRQHNEALPLLIERARKEERRIRYFEAFLGTLTPLSALALAFSVAHRAGVEGAHTLPLALLLIALVIFPSLVLAFRRRPSALALARTLDHHHRLDSVLANGIELKGNDPFSRLERARAEAPPLGSIRAKLFGSRARVGSSSRRSSSPSRSPSPFGRATGRPPSQASMRPSMSLSRCYRPIARPRSRSCSKRGTLDEMTRILSWMNSPSL